MGAAPATLISAAGSGSRSSGQRHSAAARGPTLSLGGGAGDSLPALPVVERREADPGACPAASCWLVALRGGALPTPPRESEALRRRASHSYFSAASAARRMIWWWFLATDIAGFCRGAVGGRTGQQGGQHGMECRAGDGAKWGRQWAAETSTSGAGGRQQRPAPACSTSNSTRATLIYVYKAHRHLHTTHPPCATRE